MAHLPADPTWHDILAAHSIGRVLPVFDIPASREDAMVALKSLATEQLQRGMAAFDHPPRKMYGPFSEDRHGCFVFEASCGQPQRLFNYTEMPAFRQHNALSWAYETEWDWFRSECIRELAERGVTVEPPAVTASVP